jgi:hypothetical protein
MKLIIDAGKISYQIEGNLSEINGILQNLISDFKADILPKNQNKISQNELKINQFAKPVTSELDQQTINYISSMFTYPMSNKTSVGKPAYVAALMLDMKPHTVRELMKRGNCTQAPIHTVIKRLRATGAGIHVSSNRLYEDTIVQVTSVPTGNAQPAKRKQASQTTNKNTSSNKIVFKNLAI